MNKQALQMQKLQAAKLTELGARLSALREQRELTLDEVSDRTHIPLRNLRAIEAGDLGALPEAVYVKSFIRQYANAVGVNGVQLASEFPTEAVITNDRPLWQQLIKSGHLRPAHLYAVYLALILAAVQGLSYVVNRGPAPNQFTLEGIEKLKASLPGAPLPVGPATKPANLPAVIPTNPGASSLQRPVKVGVMMTDDSWVSVTVDGKQDYEGTLKEGTQKTWTAQQKVIIKAGNAGGVLAAFNDGKAKRLGEPGSVQEVSFPPDQRFAAADASTAQN
jgi:transcriptional regulator with XRE-family HTH domain